MGRPPKPIITKEGAARAALAVIDEQGLEGLSLGLVARRLGVKAPSLYYHFKDKAALLAEVARIILLDVKVPKIAADSDWREILVKLLLATRRSLLQHPQAAPLMLQFFPRYLLLASYDRWISIYQAPPAVHMTIIEGLEKLTFGSALFAATRTTRGVNTMPKFDPVKLPRLAQAVQANRLSDEGLFEATVRRFLSAF